MLFIEFLNKILSYPPTIILTFVVTKTGSKALLANQICLQQAAKSVDKYRSLLAPENIL